MSHDAQYIQELINEGKFIEACEQSQAKFEETGDLLMLFYWTMLDADFTHKLPFDKIYDNLLKVKKVVPTKMQVQYNYYLAVASYNITDYYEAYKAAKNVISAEIPNAVAHLIYASTIVILGYNENFLYHLDKAIEYGEDDDTIDAQVYNIKLDYYIKHNKREEINKLMDEIYLKMKDRSFINACKLKIALLDLDENEIDELIKPLLLDRNVNTCIMLYDCADKFAEGGKFEKALEFARMNLAINVDMRDHILLQIGKISLAMYDTDEALEIFEDLKNSQDQEILSELPLLIAQSLAMSQDRKQTMQGLEKFYELYKQNNSPYYLIQLARTYDSAKIPLPNFILDELEIQRMVAKKRNNNEILGQIFELLQQEYIRRGKFTQATIILNEAAKYKIYYSPLQYYYASINPIGITKTLNKLIMNDDSPWGKRMQANLYYHGLYKQEVDYDKALMLAKEALDASLKDNALPCYLSMYGTILLETDPEAAVKVFKQGVDMHKKNYQYCSCCVPLYAYCMYRGIGIDKDEDQAYQIICDLVNLENTHISENAANLYGYISYLKNKNITEAYTFLRNYYEYNVQTGKYYVLSLLAEKIANQFANSKKEYEKYQKEYQKKFKHNLKFAGTKEQDYYNNCPTFPYLTNI